MSSTKIGTALFIILIILLAFAITVSTFTETLNTPAGVLNDDSELAFLNVSKEVLGGILLGTALVISALVYTVIKKQNKSKKENGNLIQGKQEEIKKIEKNPSDPAARI